MCSVAGRCYCTRFCRTVSAVHVPCYRKAYGTRFCRSAVHVPYCRKALRHSVLRHALLCLCHTKAHHVQCKPAWAVALTTSGDIGPLNVCVRFMVGKVALTQVFVRKLQFPVGGVLLPMLRIYLQQHSSGKDERGKYAKL